VAKVLQVQFASAMGVHKKRLENTKGYYSNKLIGSNGVNKSPPAWSFSKIYLPTQPKKHWILTTYCSVIYC
tara:strand:- start:652 stop:864 length:213 start_codon:yes stop_codon:yes gene_type:complete